MKKLFYLIIICPALGFSQSFLLEYDVTLNVLNRSGYLTINDNDNSYYYESMIKEKNENETKGYEDGTLNQTVFVRKGKDKKRYQIYKERKDSLYNIDFIDDKKIMVYEKFPKFDWQIQDETKKIDIYNCNKAIANFRGRNYIAWFTSEIPIHFGPWKFNGLPGAILQVYDESKSFAWTAKKIRQVETDIPLKIDDNLHLISLEKFVTENEKSKQARSDIMMLKFADRGAEVVKREFNRGRETNFEWEEEQKQD